jgi:hypothetical protein
MNITCKCLNGISVDCDYHYEPGYPGTWELPPDPPEFELYSAMATINGKPFDVLKLLDDDQKDSLMQEVEEYILDYDDY